MREFNFQRAWKEAAYPGFLCLPQNVRDLFWETHVKAEDLVQLKDLSMPWPDDAEFKNKFQEIPSETLAGAARIIFYFGHWGTPMCCRNGSYWKFSHYADQVLRARLWQEEKNIFTNENIQVKVFDGFIRICLSTYDSYHSGEVGLATLNNHISIVTSELFKLEYSYRSRDKFLEQGMAYIKKLKKKHMPKTGFLAKAIDTEAFMEEVKT